LKRIAPARAFPLSSASVGRPQFLSKRHWGHTRSICVSNFNVRELEALLTVASVPPVVNQVQFSPFKYRRALLEGWQQRNVALEAYGPLGTARRVWQHA
jgi:diketogulonate reductase-like aldo/keto reductase